MKIFISWHGEKSREVAEFLKKWLKQVLQHSDPWISSDINKGARWNEDISAELEITNIGIICLNRENLKSEWIHFEAGALSKFTKSYVCTFLMDIKPSDIAPPLSQFQHTQFNKPDVYKMLTTINQIISEVEGSSLSEKELEEIFDINWDRLFNTLSLINNKEYESKEITRSIQDLTEELIELSRDNNHLLNKISKSLQDDNFGSGSGSTSGY